MKALVKFLWLLGIFAFIISCIQKDEFLMEDELLLKKGVTDNAAPDQESISQIIKDHYIVVFKDNITNPGMEAAGLARAFGLQTGHIYEHALKGFSAYIPPQALRGLINHPLIDYIEPDITMMAFGQTIPTGISRIQATTTATSVDVDVAVIDTGIDTSHPELNVVGGVRYYLGLFTDSKYNDDNGHGSHVAGTIAARNNDIGVVGIVPGARLWAVKVLNSKGSGSMSDIAKGVDWVTVNADKIEVANMSLGGQGVSTALHTAISNCVAQGVVMVVAAGNSAVNVYGADGTFGTNDDYIPAAYPEAATISALCDTDGQPGGEGPDHTTYGKDDSFASFSNFSQQVVSTNPVTSGGAAIDLILPGVNIYSTYKSGGYATASGTSMASPHAAGLAALYISKNGRATTAQGVYGIRQALITAAKAQSDPLGLVNGGDPDNNKEKLGWAGSTTPPVNQPPVANAGPDQTVKDTDCSGNETVILDGSKSSDDKGVVRYVWTLTGYSIPEEVKPSVVLPVGQHTITLTVYDAEGLFSTDQVTVTVAANQPPVAEFSFTASGLTVSFTDKSSDDGTITSLLWNFGDGNTSTIKDPSHTYGADGKYTVSLVVTDNGEATGSVSKTVTVSQPVDITLTATARVVRTKRYADLAWSGVTTSLVDVYRDGKKLKTVTNTGTYTDNLSKVAGTNFSYYVCEVGGAARCSGVVSVSF